MVTEDRYTEVEMRRRVQARANASRKVAGVTMDKTISNKLKGKVLKACIIPASVRGLETMALTE